MKVLLTGASGFVGKRVLAKLIEQYGNDNIVALSSKKIDGIHTIPSNGYHFDRCYLANNGCDEIETIVHLGAFIPKSASEANDIRQTTSNIVSTESIIESYLPRLKRLVYISTIDVYDVRKGIINETGLTNPISLYGWSKLYCEQMIAKYCENNDIICEILRLGHVYGEGEEKYNKVMPIMVKNAIEGHNLTVLGEGNAIRSFIHVDDVAQAIANSVKLKKSEIINIVGDEQTSINELAKMIRSISGNSVDIVHVPTASTDVNYLFDNFKMKDLLLNELIPFKVGLKREYQYMKEKIYDNCI